MPKEIPSRPGPSFTAAHFVCILVLSAGLSACRLQRVHGAAPAKPPREILLSLHGSNTVGAKAAPALAAAWLKRLGADSVRIEPGATPEERLVVGRFGRQPALEKSVEIWSYGSNTGFNDLGWGKCDIAMSSKPVDAQTQQRLSFLGDMRSPYNEHVIGLDGIAVIVHPSNPVAEMDVARLADLYAGTLKDWALVPGGSPGLVAACSRNSNSGTYDVFRHSVMADRTLAEEVLVFEGNDQVAEKVAAHPRAIGYVPLASLRPDVKVLRIRRGRAVALPPSKLHVVTEDYALSRRLFLYSAAASRNPNVRVFIDFAQSQAGQEEMERAGFVAQILRLSQPEVPADAPRRYAAQASGALRVALNFRFRPGGFDLDNKARQDVVRLVRFLDEQQLRSCSLKLFGFSDNTGDPVRNRSLSLRRAQVAAGLLREVYGIEAGSILGLGSALPIASNDSEEGREKNRRIEVWLQCGAGTLASSAGSL